MLVKLDLKWALNRIATAMQIYDFKYMTLEKAIRESDSSKIINIGERQDYEVGDFFWTYMDFGCLDEGNPDAVAFVESCIGVPVQDGFLMTDECEQFLLDKGFEITEQDERSYMD